MSEFDHALAAHRRGDFATAEQACRAILAGRRNDFDALMLLADVLGATGRFSEELDHITNAVRAQPKNARARAHLGHRLLATGTPAKALVQFERALKLDAALTSATAGLAAVHEARNKYALAHKVLDPVLARGTPSPDIASVAMRVLIHDAAYDDAIALGTAVLAGDHPATLFLRQVHFELARAYERTERYDEALASASAGNAIMRAPYDRVADTKATCAMIEAFASSRVAGLARSTSTSSLPVFLVGLPRCGSTLTERILHCHPSAHGAGEIDAMVHVIGTLAAQMTTPYPAGVAGLTDAQLDAGADAYLGRIRKLAPRATRISNKHLGCVTHLGVISRMLPSAKIIHCRRNPVDHCLSCFMERLSPTQAPWAADLEDLGFRYREYTRLMQHWRDVLDVTILDFQYEELIDDQEGVTRRLLEFCDLEWDDACLRFHESKRADATLSFDQVRRPLYRSSAGRAERFGTLLDPLRKALEG